MINIPKLNINEFDYYLPENKIAKYPLPKRDESKLLVFDGKNISSDVFKNIDNYIENNSLLILNNTKVINARMIFNKETGSKIEIFCLEPVNPSDYALSFNANSECQWKCLVGNNKKWKSGILSKKINISGKETTIFCQKVKQEGNSFIIKFEWDNQDIKFSQILENSGIIPIPPYLNRNTEDIDYRRYQTIFSNLPGSVAAPTAGFHFTDTVFEKLNKKSIISDFITLHVGAGTFQPVKSKDISMHTMHTEHFIITKQNLENILKYGKNIYIVGTTSVRALESLYYILLDIYQNKQIKTSFFVEQWAPYNIAKPNLSKSDLIENCIDLMIKKNVNNLYCSTQIMIVPGYNLNFTKTIITNFHQPKSTLLLLIAALIGDNWKKIYDYALRNDFRFLSYGDSSILTATELHNK